MARQWRVGIIGRTGRGDYGHGIDTVWQQVPEAEVVGLADDDRTGLAAAAARLKIERTFADYRAMLDEVRPDVVSVCPRWIDQHAEIVLAAVERGIHVYMEKPFCRNLQEADAIVTACERTHVRLAIAHQTHYSPKLKVVQELLAEGKLGQVLEFRGRGKEDTRGGGEDLWVLGSHVLDLMRTFGGHPSWCFARVAQAERPATTADIVSGPEGIGPLVGDHVQAMYGLPGGATGYFGSLKNAGQRGTRFGLQILGTLGILEIQTGYLPSVKFLDDPTWSPGRSGKAWQDVSSAGIGVPEPLSGGELDAGNLLAVRDLLAAIEENRPTQCGPEEGRAVVEMIAAVFASHVAGRPVDLPLVERSNPLG